MEMKDEIITRLNEELVKRETQLKFEVEKMKKRFDTDLTTMKDELEAVIDDLQTKLGQANLDLVAVEQYVLEKNKHEENTIKLEKDLVNQRQQMFDALEEQERKFLEEKATMLRELDEERVRAAAGLPIHHVRAGEGIRDKEEDHRAHHRPTWNAKRVGGSTGASDG